MSPMIPDLAAHPVGLSIVVPVYRGATTIGRLVRRARPARTRWRAGDRAGERRQPGQFRRCLPGNRRHRQHAGHLPGARTDFGEHNAVMTGLRHARGAYVITMDDDLQNPPEEVVKLYNHARLGGWDVVYTALRGKEARRLAQPRQPLRQQGRRCAARQAEGPLFVLFPLHERAGGA
ncbi:glycosyltransferase [Dankookia sp. P2]|uniref:glycosyltransferase n=1 Tax=Dankookia sp. P2 TaxID=3423955 RepID=UPI003D66BF39